MSQPTEPDQDAASPDGATAGAGEPPANGHDADGPPRLPPPWERVPAEPVSAAPERVQWDARGQLDTHVERDTGGERDERPAAPREHPNGLGTDKPAPTELADARTVGLEARGGYGAPGDDLGATSGSVADSVADSGAAASGIGPPGGLASGWPRNRRPRQANLQLKRLDPWSVLKVALVLSVVLYLVWMVAVGVLYGALDGIGVWERINGQYSDFVAEHAGDKLISGLRVFGFAAVVGAVNSLLMAVAFSASAFVYNVSADLVGGIEVTLSERD